MKLTCALFLACIPVFAVEVQLPGMGEHVRILKDFVADFDTANVTNSSSASAGLNEKSGGVSVPAIFLHPEAAGDATAAFEHVALPAAESGNRLFLVFRVGLREGIPWDAASGKSNGVRFAVGVDGRTVFSELARGDGWQSRAIDMNGYAGKPVTISLHTNAVDGNSSYDWAMFGEPMLVSMKDRPLQDVSAGTPGLLVCEIACAEASKVNLLAGRSLAKLDLNAGTYWVPVLYQDYGDAPMLKVASGSALLTRTVAAPFAPRLDSEVELSSPLVTAGRPFSMLCRLRNTGLGTYNKPASVGLVFEGKTAAAAYGPEASQRKPVTRMATGETCLLRWDGLVAPEPGAFSVTATCGGRADVFAFPPEPDLPQERPETAGVSLSTTDGVLGIAMNRYSRLTICGQKDGPAYGAAETWNGAQWQRVATLYPLTALTYSRDGLHAADARVRAVEQVGESLRVLLDGADPSAFATALTITPSPDSARIRIASEGRAPRDLGIAAWCGPQLLAGDRAFGARKAFAIFPGLEYLESDEPSSSTRDLAYPLNDRRVPAAYKITTPLMAVQGDDALVALLWDARQEWAPGQRYPAARFLAPKVEDGPDYVHLSMFVPSVSSTSGVPENACVAEEHPFNLPANTPMKLDCWLALDHKANFGVDSVVQGPHKGGLVLQAMRHWFEAYGVPEPSPQPRDWDLERALCRDAFLHALWNEPAQGWSHCVGWAPHAIAGYCTLLTLDRRLGVAEPEASESQRRVDAVIGRALAGGKGALWSRAGCHIMSGELPFYHGNLGESMEAMRQAGWGQLRAREKDLWMWRPSDPKLNSLGKPGAHTLGQAAAPVALALRAARLSGDRELAAAALDAAKQMELYEVPRGAQTWECPLYQPDILAAAQAVRAYCEAYRLTGDAAHLAHARYWAWTGLPFIYTWEMDGYPTMRYNVISVIGSTFYTHSWIGLPVVWCGLVYAYALQDLAPLDTSFDWRRVAQGITNSAMWQQYADGPSKGTYPDSWNMVKNAPNPADIAPEAIWANEFRLRDLGPEIHCARVAGPGGAVFINAAAEIGAAACDENALTVAFKQPENAASYALVAPVDEPTRVEGAGERVSDSAALQQAEAGWLYDSQVKGVIVKLRGPCSIKVDLAAGRV